MSIYETLTGMLDLMLSSGARALVNKNMVPTLTDFMVLWVSHYLDLGP